MLNSENYKMINKYFGEINKNNPHGFTLIELLIVIAIIGVLVTIVVVAIDPVKVINDSNDTKARAELNQVRTSLQLYFNENNSYPPAASWIADLENGYIRKVPTIPAITYGENGTNYDAWIAVNNSGSEETDSHSKCTSDGNETTGGGSTNYWICPD